ncbi:MAG: hypothetical protein ABI629_00440 [bacterium]
MSTQRKLVSIASAFALVAAIGGSALAQQSKDNQKCVNAINKDTGKVGATQGKENSSCVKAGTKGAVTAGCPTADLKGKVGKTSTKTTSDEAKSCGAGAPFGYTSAAQGNSAMQGSELDLLADTFGSTDLSAVISTDKVIGKCQAGVNKDLEKVAVTYAKAFSSCKKAALKAGATSVNALTACIGDDPKLKVSKTVTKLGADITKNCSAVTIATAFPGVCSASTAATLGACLAARAKCQMCEGLAGTDNLNADCDLEDNGAADGSCVIPVHLCTLDTTPSTDSQIQIHLESLPVPLAFGLSGSLNIGGEGSQAVCEVNNLNPISIPAIGFVCITPGAGCAPGHRDCNGGDALGVDVQSDGNIGSCTGNSDCAAQCAASCGAGKTSAGACTGFCSAGAQGACADDMACLPNDGACNGDDPVSTPNVCQCTCTNENAFGASAAGDIQCQLSSHLVVETAAPCDGTDVSINVGDSCIPVSTQRAVGKITNSNYGTGTVPPAPNVNDQTGAEISCAALDSSTTTGLVGVGAVNFFGSALGDLSVGLKATCQ